MLKIGVFFRPTDESLTNHWKLFLDCSKNRKLQLFVRQIRGNLE